jgi:hypothetical protein
MWLVLPATFALEPGNAAGLVTVALQPSAPRRTLLLALHRRGRPLSRGLQDFRFSLATIFFAGRVRRRLRLALVIPTPQRQPRD